MDPTIYYIICGIGAYLFGSVSPALILSDQIMKKDVRKYGSGNAGSTNMFRTFGWKMGVGTFLLDVVKGGLAVYFAMLLGDSVAASCGIPIVHDIGAMIASIAVVVGHNWPVYYGFRGGKGIAATFGVLLIWQLWPTVIVFTVCIVLVAITRFMSVSSILGTMLSAAVAFTFYPGQTVHQVTICALCVFSLIAHRANIVRLLKGTENKMSFGRKKE